MEQIELTKAAGKPFTLQLEIRPDNDDCSCALCVARRAMIAAIMNGLRRASK